MKIEHVYGLPLVGVKLIQFGRFDDVRGWFCEPYRESQLREVIPGFRCVQVNQSLSRSGVVRGLHIQTDPPMGKLIRVLDGLMEDLCLDLRRESQTFGLAISVRLWPGEWIWIPPGIAHGNFFLADATIEYLCTAEYNQAGESCVCPWAEDIQWIAGTRPPTDAIATEKDRNGMTVAEWMRRSQP